MGIKQYIPTPLKQLVRNYLDGATWRGQPKLVFDNSKLRAMEQSDIDGAMQNVQIAQEFAEDHAKISKVYSSGEIFGGVNPGDRRALYHLVSSLKPRRVLEIGTHVGASTLNIASALHRHGGTVLSADIVDVNAPDAAWKQYGVSAPPIELVAKLGLSDVVTFQAKPAEEILGALNGFDFIFLDGDHSSSAVYREISAALRVLEPGGIILLHDYYPGGKPFVPGKSAIIGPVRAGQRIAKENPGIRILPLGELPWPTKDGTRFTSLAIVAASKK